MAAKKSVALDGCRTACEGARRKCCRAGAFVDTDIWVYAHLKAPGDQRHERALALMQGRGDLVISPQVVAEYCSVMLHNLCVIDSLRDDLA